MLNNTECQEESWCASQHYWQDARLRFPPAGFIPLSLLVKRKKPQSCLATREDKPLYDQGWDKGGFCG